MCEGKPQNITTEMVQILGLGSMSVHTHLLRYRMNTKQKYITHDAPTIIPQTITLSNRYTSTDKSPPSPQHAVSSNATQTETQTQLTMAITTNTNVVCSG
eukprot:107342_1